MGWPRLKLEIEYSVSAKFKTFLNFDYSSFILAQSKINCFKLYLSFLFRRDIHTSNSNIGSRYFVIPINHLICCLKELYNHYPYPDTCYTFILPGTFSKSFDHSESLNLLRNPSIPALQINYEGKKEWRPILDISVPLVRGRAAG